MSQAIPNVIAAFGLEPILVDVGACGSTPEQWTSLARFSTYLGFDPDARGLDGAANPAFKRSIILNWAITDKIGATAIEFNLTRSPPCSSVLASAAGLRNYLFSDLFEVEKRITAPAMTLDDVLRESKIPRIDWIKLDTQGTDLRLLRSIKAEVRDRILAVDVEPGLIDVYEGEDLFHETHAYMKGSGFWLCALDVKNTVRMRRRTLDKLRRDNTWLLDKDIYRGSKHSPGWCEARYLRTIEHLESRNSDPTEYALLWCFVVAEGQVGYALDIADAFAARFGRTKQYDLLSRAPLARLRRSRWRLVNVGKRWLPSHVKMFAKRLFSLR